MVLVEKMGEKIGEKNEVQGILSQAQPGFLKVVLVSFLLHAVALSAGFLLVKAEKERIFYTPVFTVELVAPPPSKTKPKIVKKAPAKKVKKKKAAKTVKKPPKVAKKPAKVKKKPPEKKPKTTLDERLLISDAVTRIEKKAEEEKERELIASRIEEIKKKAEAEKKDLDALKKDIAEEKKIKRRLEALKKELASAQAETKSVEVDTSPKAPTPTPAVKAPKKITRELFELEFKAYYNKVGSRIQSLWVYTGADRGLEAWLSIKIARSGELRAVGVERRSGNSLFDESAMKAVKKAAPFPPLPEGLEGDFLELGVRFCPGGCKQSL